MALFAASFTGVAATAAQDLFEIVAGTKRLILREVIIGQYSDFGTSAAELLPVSLVRGHTTPGSGGTAITPRNLCGYTGAAAALAAVTRNNTTIASGGTQHLLRAEIWNIQIPWIWRPILDECIMLEAAQNLVVRLDSAPADSLTLVGTLLFEEDF